MGLLLIIEIALGAACVNSAFTPSTTLRLQARPEGCYLDMIFQGAPPFPYVVIGRVTTDSSAPGLFALGENNEAAVQRLQDEACRVGAHGLLQLGAASQGSWTNGGYSRSTTGAAVAFVYVDAQGRPQGPPRGPSLVIHPGAYSPPPRPRLPPSPSVAPTPSITAPPAAPLAPSPAAPLAPAPAAPPAPAPAPVAPPAPAAPVAPAAPAPPAA